MILKNRPAIFAAHRLVYNIIELNASFLAMLGVCRIQPTPVTDRLAAGAVDRVRDSRRQITF